MTRLTPEAIKDVPDRMSDIDDRLRALTGRDLRGIACVASGVRAEDVPFGSYSVAVVPMTSGKGIIGGFAESVASAVDRIGMKAFITRSCDVAGISEAVSSGADIIFMADDESFIALNTHSRSFSDNIRSTARGFVTALSLAEGGLEGKTVLVIGAGRVGSEAVRMLREEGASVEVTDIVRSKAKALEMRYDGVVSRPDVEEAIRDNAIIFNASPGSIPGDLIREGAVISSPGVPYAFDRKGEGRARLIIHDVLGLGVAVMAVSSAASLYEGPVPDIKATSAVSS